MPSSATSEHKLKIVPNWTLGRNGTCVCVCVLVRVCEAVPCLGHKNSDPFGPLLYFSLFRFVGDYLTFWTFCSTSQFRSVLSTLFGSDSSEPYSGSLSFLFPAPDIHTVYKPTFLFLHGISGTWGFLLIHVICIVGLRASLGAPPTACSTSCPACLCLDVPVGWSFQIFLANPVLITGSPFSQFSFFNLSFNFGFVTAKRQWHKGFGTVFTSSYASLSVVSFCSMPLSPGVHTTAIRFFSDSYVSFSVQSATSNVFA